MVHTYPPLRLEVRTPRLTLAGATDELLERLVPVVRAGIADTEPWPFDDPMSLYEDSPDREWRWLRGIWAGRARVDPGFWRLYFVVLPDGEPIGMQDLIGLEFAKFGTVSTFSWLAPGRRGRGIGKEMRAAVLHLAFAGLGAREATSEAFTDNRASNQVSRALGYEPKGTDWDTRRGEAALVQRWRLTRDTWDRVGREDVELVGVQECLPALGARLTAGTTRRSPHDHHQLGRGVVVSRRPAPSHGHSRRPHPDGPPRPPGTPTTRSPTRCLQLSWHPGSGTIQRPSSTRGSWCSESRSSSCGPAA